ncbi:MBOAT family protein [Bacillus methanolicus]|uniref:MBOAT family O-acyltransferase n=1 Tax=Bacillus methanolicus TaxID=1471 RepID=UPI00200E796C|nr:MBOAT family protein [Bacillus methanolicus]UQD53434.1 MBOAT family protein [Bacillus methanolicus]
MIFNSYEFIFAFLPITWLVFFLLNKLELFKLSTIWLVVSSLFFYSWWNVAYLPLILILMIFNYLLGSVLRKSNSGRRARYLLVFGVAVNLAVLCYFKYYDFFISNINFAFHTNIPLLHLTLPLAISFFTFQKIAYLVDSYRKETEQYNFWKYALFVVFFPQLIAGPIVHHKEVIPQFSKALKVLNVENVSKGIFIFTIGLFKKVVIADTLAAWATAGFDTAGKLTFIDAWMTSLSYTFQLYFDFSGYTDMAIGAALLFNIRLPINFNSPYKAVNILDFWKRWHMTLTRFLTKYLYIPLGGNRKGTVRTYINVLIVFFLSGLWHGAGWTFIFWGTLHGIASLANRFWQQLGLRMNKYLSWFLTFQFVNVAWVFFRAKTWEDAIKVLKGMAGLNGFVLPEKFAGMLGFHDITPVKEMVLSTITGTSIIYMFVYIIIIFVIVLACRNSVKLMDDLKPNWQMAFFASALFMISIFNMTKVSEFLYFNF